MGAAAARHRYMYRRWRSPRELGDQRGAAHLRSTLGDREGGGRGPTAAGAQHTTPAREARALQAQRPRAPQRQGSWRGAAEAGHAGWERARRCAAMLWALAPPRRGRQGAAWRQGLASAAADNLAAARRELRTKWRQGMGGRQGGGADLPPQAAAAGSPKAPTAPRGGPVQRVRGASRFELRVRQPGRAAALARLRHRLMR
jgi:hypothetical protein